MERLVHHIGSTPIRHSVETGTGKSTLLLSHLSDHHIVFTIDDPVQRSLELVKNSSLLRKEAVEFVIGPTQRTVSRFALPSELQLVLIDGPHGYPFPELEYHALYPHLTTGALLVIDDIHIPTVNHLFEVLREDPMYEVEEVVRTTAFLRRTTAPVFDPEGEGWNIQPYNRRRFPLFRNTRGFTALERAKAAVPEPIRRELRKWPPFRR
jgi:predicted O-methyltransferase YrrM